MTSEGNLGNELVDAKRVPCPEEGQVMFAKWFPSLDQSLEVMVGRYATAKAIRHEIPHFKSADARVLFLAKESSRGNFFKELSDEVRREGHKGLKKPKAIIEFAWLMFFLKDWKKLADAIRDTAPLHKFPKHIADLYFLSAYRLNWKIIAEGVDYDGFENIISDAITFVRKYWPSESRRADLFSTLLQNSLGERLAARDMIMRLSGELELIPPLAAAKATLFEPERDTTSWPLEIVRANKSRATLVSIDQTYYERYASTFIAIHAVTNPDRSIHFHCVGFDPRTLSGAVDINETIGFTIDRTDLTNLSQRDRIGYYACARLMHAIAYLDIYTDILISDADGSVDLSASEVLAELAEADVVIKSKVLRPGHVVFNLPWSTIPAAANLVRDTQGGRLFAQYLRDYLAKIFILAQGKKSPMWFADQCALFYAYVDLKDQIAFKNCDKVLYNQGRNWALFAGEASKKTYIEKVLKEHKLAN